MGSERRCLHAETDVGRVRRFAVDCNKDPDYEGRRVCPCFSAGSSPSFDVIKCTMARLQILLAARARYICLPFFSTALALSRSPPFRPPCMLAWRE